MHRPVVGEHPPAGMTARGEKEVDEPLPAELEPATTHLPLSACRRHLRATGRRRLKSQILIDDQHMDIRHPRFALHDMHDATDPFG